MERRGLSPRRFASTVDRQFLCPLCQKVARGPVACSQCSVVYCSACLPRQKCPACSCSRFEQLVGVALKMYAALQFSCNCGKAVSLGELDRHEAACKSAEAEVARLTKAVADLTSENTALKRENKQLREELTALKGGVQRAEPVKADPQPKKRAEVPKAPITPQVKPLQPVREEHKSPSAVPTPQGEKRPVVIPEKRQNVPAQPEKRPVQPDRPSATPQVPKPEERKAVPESTLNQAAMTIQRAFRNKKARELRAALQEKRAERMQHTGFKKKRNEAMAAFKNVQQVVQNLNLPGKEGRPKPGKR